MTAWRVMIFEDDPLYRATLVMLLGTLPQFALVGEHASPLEVIEALERGGPVTWDVALMDLEMPELDGITATRRIKAVAPELKVLVVTAFEDPQRILQAVCAGADGYLVKRAGHDELTEHLGTVIAGGAPLTATVARTVLDLLRDRKVAKRTGAPLSPRERQ